MSANAAECPPANAPVSVRRRKMHKVQNTIKWLLKKQKNARMIELYNAWFQAAKKDANALKEFLKLQDEFFKDAQVSELESILRGVEIPDSDEDDSDEYDMKI